MHKSIELWFDWLFTAYREPYLGLNNRIQALEAVSEVNSKSTGYLRTDMDAALRQIIELRDQITLLRAELAEKQRPNAKIQPRNWSLFREEMKRGNQ